MRGIKPLLQICLTTLGLCCSLAIAQVEQAPAPSAESVQQASPQQVQQQPISQQPEVGSPEAYQNTPALDPQGDTSLETIYQENESRSKFTSPGYIFQVFGILALLLGSFYMISRLWKSQNKPFPLAPGALTDPTLAQTSAAKGGNILNMLFNQPPNIGQSALTPYILSRVRLSPHKEIHIVQIGDRQLVIGSTPQQMTLLTEFVIEQKNPEKPKRQAAPQATEEPIRPEEIIDEPIRREVSPTRVRATRQTQESIHEKYLRQQLAQANQEEPAEYLSDYDEVYDPR